MASINLNFNHLFVNIRYILLILLFAVLSISLSYGQRDVSDDVIGTPYCGIQYGMNWTGGDLAERYGLTNTLGGFAGYKTKNNFIFGLDGNFIFGNKIRIDGVLDNIRDEAGNVTNTSGGPAIVLLFNRGFHANATVGKVFPVLSPNPNSGIMVQLSAGYLLHKLRVETQEDDVPQLQGDYLKGYDRLTIGVNTAQFIGYSFMANQGIYNFYAGFYCQQGFTQNQRSEFWDQPNQTVSQDLRLDVMYGFRVGWLIPIYKRQPKDYYYN